MASGTSLRHVSASSEPGARSSSRVVSLCSVEGAVTTLTIDRDAVANSEMFLFPSRVNVSNVSAVRSVARSLCALPFFPKSVMSCPMDFGVDYALHFSESTNDGVLQVGVITLDVSGCQSVTGMGAVRWAARSASFWRVLGNAIGVKDATSLSFVGKLKNT